MEKAFTASFQLQKFSIPNFTFDEADEELSTIDIQLNPTGIYNTLSGGYVVILSFIATGINPKDEKVSPKNIVTGILKADFTFDDKPKIENIPEFFYSNSLAIIFPYLRAFISNLTLQTGTRLLILPLLNLTSLTNRLKENTKVFE